MLCDALDLSTAWFAQVLAETTSAALGQEEAGDAITHPFSADGAPHSIAPSAPNHLV